MTVADDHDRARNANAVDLWLLDLALTAVSFLLAYRLRVLLQFQDRTLMPFAVYVPALAVMLPAWALVLPAFRVYRPAGSPIEIAWRMAKAVAAAWILASAAQTVIVRMHLFVNWGSSSIILILTLFLNYLLLTSYRLLLLRKEATLAVQRRGS